MKNTPNASIAALLACLVGLAVIVFSRPAHPHDWYGEKYSRVTGGGSCCSGNEATGDCRKLDRAWPDDDGVWHFIYPDDGKEYVVPEAAMHDPNESPEPFQAHGCVYHDQVLCFWPKRAGG